MQLAILKLWYQGLKSLDISKLLLISEQTLSSFIRDLAFFLVPRYYSSFKKIGGKDTIVEIDESKFGKVKYGRGHRVDGVWVFGAVERTKDRRIFLIDVENRKKETLVNYLKMGVDENSYIFSDCFRSYSELNNHFALHLTVNHSLNFVNPLNGCHTNTIEGNWRAIKSETPMRNRTRRNIRLYLVRFMIKRESNNSFEALLNYLF